MKIINLKKYSGTVVRKHIDDYCGGKVEKNKFWVLFDNHIVGLQYCDPGYGIAGPTHNVSLSFFKNGLGVYFRNIENNRLVLLTNQEIRSILIEKRSDVVRPFDFSMFTLLMKLGVNYHIAKKILMPKEIIEDNAGICIITTEDHHFTFTLKKMNAAKVGEIFQQTGLESVLHISIASPVIIGSGYPAK
ncbi:MAG: hypothetical protein IPJ13_14255 [Saprospiraceae bacterium]|nr:hypothetical protein [Saprospiraceae bacterium]